MLSVNCNGKLLDLSQPKVMGIINITPDSFHRGSRVENIAQAIDKIGEMIVDGASMIDIGGQSSRPRADKIEANEEITRILPSIQAIRTAFPEIILSVDTFYAEVAKECILEGVDIINDISAFSIDEQLIEVIAEHQVAYVLMHMLGTPQSMQDEPSYENVALEVLQFLQQKWEYIKQRGLNNVIIDPGFGFGKSLTFL